jgi:DNA-binding beta-propeller fold protein YncE
MPLFTNTAKASLVAIGLASFMTDIGSVYAASPSPAPSWPPPPAEERIRFVQSISTPADIGARVSVLGRLKGLITGMPSDRIAMSKPFGISIDQQGNLCVTDTAAGAILLLNRAEHRFHRWNSISGTALPSPVAAIVHNGQLFVADSALAKVLVADLDGHLQFEIQNLIRPTGLTLCDGRLFVADAGAHCIAVFDLKGNPLHRFGSRGTGPDQFNAPTHIASDGNHRLFVTDSLNERIQIFDMEGRHLGTIGRVGSGGGEFIRPKGVAVDSFGHIYVADALHDNIQVFDEAGRFLLNWGESGSGPGEFWMPTGIAISSKNEIFVADSYNRRIQVFQYVGKE